MKQKMSDQRKAILIYSLELAIFAIVFGVVGVLKITNIWKSNETTRIIFNFITIFGSIWVFIDFFWTLFDKKRRTNHCLLDKILLLPLGIFMIAYDILCFTKATDLSILSRYCLSIAFFYISIIYLFEAFYHYKHPLGMLLEASKEDNAEEKKE